MTARSALLAVLLLTSLMVGSVQAGALQPFEVDPALLGGPARPTPAPKTSSQTPPPQSATRETSTPAPETVRAADNPGGPPPEAVATDAGSPDRAAEATAPEDSAGVLAPAETGVAPTAASQAGPHPVEPATRERYIAPAPGNRTVARQPLPPATAAGTIDAPQRATIAPPAVAPSSAARRSLEPFAVDPALLGGTAVPDVPVLAGGKPAPEKPPQAAGNGSHIGSTERRVAVAPPERLPLGDPSTEVEADRIEGSMDTAVVASGQAYIKKGWDELFGDTLRWDFTQNQATGEGNIVKRDQDSEITGSRFVFNQDTQTGQVDDVGFTLASLEATGTASRLVFDGPGRYRTEDTRYTTCNFDDPDWLLKADSIEIDRDQNEGVARNARLLAGGKVPLFYLPRFQFALKNERKTGFLTPTVAITNRTGPQVFLPFYWNIAPNMDATFTGRYMTKRGLQMGGELRYLHEDFASEVRAEYLPEDDVRGDKRWAMTLDHRHNFGERLSGLLDVQRVSDDDYFRDLRNNIGASGSLGGPMGTVQGGTATRLLPQRAALLYSGDGWSLTSQVQTFQVLQTETRRILQPYDMLPNVRFVGARTFGGLVSVDALGDFAAFSLRSDRFDANGNLRREGQRLVLNPGVSLPLRNSWGYIVPRASLHYTRYALDDLPGLPSDYSRSVPTFSLDSGMTLERSTDGGGRQTLEPRMFYAYTPFREQSMLPVFDTGRYDFNFSEIFSANRFIGNDRIGDANQLTTGVTSRFIDAGGTERVKVTLAQRFTFEDLRVGGPGDPFFAVSPPPTKGASDVLGEFSGRVTDSTSVITRVQYNTDRAEVQKGFAVFRYSPELGKVLNLGYRYNRELSVLQPGLQQLDLSTQWPLTSKLYLLARTNYSLLDNRQTEGLLGLEYFGGCWSIRVAAQTLTTATATSTKAIFIVLDLKGLASSDSATYSNILTRHIGGYSDPSATNMQRGSFE